MDFANENAKNLVNMAAKELNLVNYELGDLQPYNHCHYA